MSKKRKSKEQRIIIRDKEWSDADRVVRLVWLDHLLCKNVNLDQKTIEKTIQYLCFHKIVFKTEDGKTILYNVEKGSKFDKPLKKASGH